MRANPHPRRPPFCFLEGDVPQQALSGHCETLIVGVCGFARITSVAFRAACSPSFALSKPIHPRRGGGGRSRTAVQNASGLPELRPYRHYRCARARFQVESPNVEYRRTPIAARVPRLPASSGIRSVSQVSREAATPARRPLKIQPPRKVPSSARNPFMPPPPNPVASPAAYSPGMGTPKKSRT